MPSKRKRVVFDIETDPFSDAFRKAETMMMRTRHAPKMRLACLFDERIGKYLFYLPEDATNFITYLKSADEIISFNGKRFDLPVLRRHYKLRGKVPTNGRHIDLFEIMTKQAGFRVSLDMASKLNLGRGKHTLGRKMINLDLKGLKKACRADVSQTYRLWKLYSQRKLKYPEYYRQREYDLSIDEIGRPNSILEYARIAGFRDPDDPGEMTDGEQAEYLALLEGGGDESWAADFFGFDLAGYRLWEDGVLPIDLRKASSKTRNRKSPERKHRRRNE